MNWTPDLVARMDRYLAEVRQALSDRPEPVQHDICAELERQIREAMDALPETAHAAEALEAALARMDPPSAFVPAPEESPRTPARGGPRPWMWFALALAFLAVNVAGWYGVTHRPALAAVLSAATESGDALATESEPLVWAFSDDLRADDTPAALAPAIEGVFEWASPRKLVFTPDAAWPAGLEVTAPLAATLRTTDGRPVESSAPLRVNTPEPALQAVSVSGFSPNREATLRLAFNGMPDIDSIRKIPIDTLNGQLVPLGLVADVEEAMGPNMVNRENGQRRIYVSANVADRDLVAPDIPCGYSWPEVATRSARGS